MRVYQRVIAAALNAVRRAKHARVYLDLGVRISAHLRDDTLLRRSVQIRYAFSALSDKTHDTHMAIKASGLMLQARGLISRLTLISLGRLQDHAAKEYCWILLHR